VLALAEATRMMQGNDYLARENIDAYLKHNPSTEAAIRTGSPVIYDPKVEIPVNGLADMESTHRKNGRTEYDKPLDLAKVIDDRFTKKAVELLGK
jgi:NitT/TauT family transport system substrate-binding protein